MKADGIAPIGRRRALDRAMDAALKNPTKRRRRAGEIVHLVHRLLACKLY